MCRHWNAGDLITTSQYPRMTRTGTGYQFVLRYNAPMYKSGSNIDSFQFKVFDDYTPSATSANIGTVSISVTYQNYPPTAAYNPNPVICYEDGNVTFTLIANDPDLLLNGLPRDTGLTVRIKSLPLSSIGTVYNASGGVANVGDVYATSTGVSGGGALITFKPVPLHYGSPFDQSVTFVVNDGHVDSTPPLSVTINVIHVNHPPTIGALATTVNTPETLTPSTTTFQLTASDVDIIDTLTVRIAGLPAKGTLSQGSTALTVGSTVYVSGGLYPVTYYVPALMIGTPFDTFIAQVDDGHVQVNLTLTVNVVITNFPPQGIATSPQSCYEDSYGILTISGADPEYIRDTLTLYHNISFIRNTQRTCDQRNESMDGDLHTHSVSMYGYPLDSFQFTVGQGVVNSTTPTLVLINVVHVNHAPVANSLSVTCAENSFVDITLTASDIDYSWGDNLNVTFLPLSGMTTGATLTQDIWAELECW